MDGDSIQQRDSQMKARNVSAKNERCEISVTEPRHGGEGERTDLTGEASMPDVRAQESANQANCGHETLSAEIVQRRKANREGMRRRRAAPVQCASEQQKRKSRQPAADTSESSASASVAQSIGRICAMCHLRGAAEEISRLAPSAFTRGGYVQVRLPYCGRC